MEPTKFDMKYAAVRRAIIEQRFSKLNDKQREAVYQTEVRCSSWRVQAAARRPCSSTASSTFSSSATDWKVNLLPTATETIFCS